MAWTGTASYRDLILDNVKATLAAILVANGFEVDVQEVTDVIRDIEDEFVNELDSAGTPIHQVIPGPEEYEPIGSGAGDVLVRSTFTVEDWILVHFDDLERVIADTKKAMWADRRRGTHPTSGDFLADDTLLTNVETAEQIFHPYELVRFEWEIPYTHLDSTP